MSILQMSFTVPVTPESLSSAKTLSIGFISDRSVLSLTTRLSNLSIKTSIPYKLTQIRMGGGPRTYPGGVSKWQWKRMQAKKSKQLLKARLARERQIYEMRKRAELKAAVTELERPWEAVEKPPNLFSASADEQLQVLADRFQKPGGMDMWSERDGPELFRHDNGLPSSRFFPKGVVHSLQPNRKLAAALEDSDGLGLEEESSPGPVGGRVGETGLQSKNRGEYKNSKRNLRSSRKGGSLDGAKGGEGGNYSGKIREKGNTRTYSSDSERKNSRDYRRNNGDNRRQGEPIQKLWRSKKGREKGENVNGEVFDMSLQNDGVYGTEDLVYTVNLVDKDLCSKVCCPAWSCSSKNGMLKVLGHIQRMFVQYGLEQPPKPVPS
ncbi:copper ion transmembrane transporters [Striga asiatica]|uniref:Copper ion transmembrane transporters n=1 Tax=Striga asiatica TaxID=4170 RepID=A0A5A7RFA2_STRAF|nr:copper ion transmembrane transporters [Striga asiatica]